MNLPRFLKETDAIIAALSKEALGAFIHETARTLPLRPPPFRTTPPFCANKRSPYKTN